MIVDAQWPVTPGIIAFDEIHKYRPWKQFIKGEYDKHCDKYSFLITGSARLDIYRKGGDSLQGRYHHHRLHPFSLAEILGNSKLPVPSEPLDLSTSDSDGGILSALTTFGGFPNPSSSRMRGPSGGGRKSVSIESFVKM
jgi:predicted AAA+ superfamily ATPase